VSLVVVAIHCQDHLEVSASVGAKHRPVDRCLLRMSGNPWGNGEAVLVAGDGVTHQHLVGLYVEDEHEAMAASKGQEAVALAALQREASGRHLIRGVESRHEVAFSDEEAEEWRVAEVVAAEAADEARVGGEAAPALADEGRAGEGGGLRREAEEDLPEDVVIFQRPE
jgi:hypothetical protein